jgi:hypothetical protein
LYLGRQPLTVPTHTWTGRIREFPKNRNSLGNGHFSNKEVGAGFPHKEEGNSSFLGIPGELGFRIKGTRRVACQKK